MQDMVIDAVAEEFRLTSQQVREIFELFEKGVTVPFLVHYRKDLVGALAYDDLKTLLERKRDLRKLEKRKREVVKKLRERELVTPELEESIAAAKTLRAVNDIFLPYRPKKHSRSVEAVALGLEPLARKLLLQEEHGLVPGEAAQAYVDAAKGLPDVMSVLKGCAYIICDWIAEERTLRDGQREILRRNGNICVKQSREHIPDRLSKEFKDYFSFEEKVHALHPYRMLIILRGSRLRALEYGFEAPMGAMRETAAQIYLEGAKESLKSVMDRRDPATVAETFHVAMKGDRGKSAIDDGEADSSIVFPDIPEGVALDEMLVMCIDWSLEHILIPVLVRELDRELNDKAEAHAIGLFKRNLRAILMQQPLRGMRVLAVAPGYRTGCKLAALDESGTPIDHAIVYPHTPQNEVEQAKTKIEEMVAQHGLQVVAIGDGTACRETETLISGLIQEKLPDLQYTVVSEAGMPSYVTSKLAKQELPGIQQSIKGTISIGRRLLDPISELVKLEPKVLCSSPYVQNVSARRLKDALGNVIEECVCEVGVELNSAELNMLRNIAGLNGNRARNLLAWRTQHGEFASRAQLMEVDEIDDKIYTQCAGFMSVAKSETYFDRTRIHPEYYEVATKLCEELGLDVAKLDTPEERQKAEDQKKQLNLTALEAKYGVHYLTIRDIVVQLAEGWTDPRVNWSAPVLRKSQLKLDEIEPGQMLRGVVRNIVDFGVFVDVGVSEDGLIHVSELSDGYVHSPYEVVSIGDIIQVRVLKVDTTANRIALSLRKGGDRAKGRSRPPRRGGRSDAAGRTGRPGEAGARSERSAAEARAASGVQVPQSTVGTTSRRFQKAAIDGAADKEDQTAAPKPDETRKAPAQRKRPKPKPRSADGTEQPVEGLINMVQFGKLEKRGKTEK